MIPGDLTIDQFEFLVHQYGLEPEYHLSLEGDDILINEEWKSDNKKGVAASRAYKFSSDFIDLIRESDRKFVLSKILDLYLRDENYEQCVIIRDLINSSKSLTLKN